LRYEAGQVRREDLRSVVGDGRQSWREKGGEERSLFLKCRGVTAPRNTARFSIGAVKKRGERLHSRGGSGFRSSGVKIGIIWEFSGGGEDYVRTRTTEKKGGGEPNKSPELRLNHR